MPDLVGPSTDLHTPWLEAHKEWGPGLHEDGFGLTATDEVDTPTGFATWIARLTSSDDTVCRWIVEDGNVLGAIALRHTDTDYTSWAGHIGFGIRPSARRRGLASWALRHILDEARAHGMNRVLAVCALDNIASARTIENAGGVFEEIRETPYGPARRFWIEL
ncbi:GNAT family N-acetyltransferase [Actinocrispum sp. NPDC049592]|uniref:GNAT family N-acetyltransferase n=1 Tax=Actinocrispum sp. NPDC049592 TaxID=3154835 RepID=UPI00343B9C61